MTHEHKFTFLCTSTCTIGDTHYFVDRYKCSVPGCEKVYAIDSQTGEKIDLKGLVGEETE